MISEFDILFSRENFPGNRTPFLLSFMGEGEPFLNFEAVVQTIEQCFEKRTEPKLSFAISTAGKNIWKLEQLAKIALQVPIKLQISLHGPNDEIRKKMVPISDPLNAIIAAVTEYQSRCNGKVDWNYVLCKGINDDLALAALLPQILPSGAHIKFNRLNPTPQNKHLLVEKETIDLFRSVVETGGCTTEYYQTDGSDIYAACGQLSYSIGSDKSGY